MGSFKSIANQLVEWFSVGCQTEDCEVGDRHVECTKQVQEVL